MQISHREKKIIESLLKNPRSFLSIHQIAQNLGVSSRTVHRELKFVEETLSKMNLTLERQTGKGLRMTGSDIDFALLSEQLEMSTVLDLSVEERKVIILYTLIKAKDPVKIYSLASEIGISINKLSKELENLESDLSRQRLTLQKKRGEGLQLLGDELNKRQLLADIMLEKLDSTSVYSVIEDHFVYQTLNDTNLKDLVDMDQIFSVERLLMDELSELPYVLLETAYLTLTIHIVLAIERIRNDEQVSIADDIIQSLSVTPEFKVAERLADSLSEAYQINFDKEEVIFITMHLRGAKRRISESEVTVDISQKTDQLINEVSSLTHHDFTDNHTLREGLLLHLVPALNRISGGIDTYNPLTTMIKEDYKRLFQAVHSALESVFPDAFFPDNEIAFIVLHFGGAMKHSSSSVLIVCTSGFGTSRILSKLIEEQFPSVHVSKLASVSDLKALDLTAYDYIISTVGLDINQPYTVVNPLLPESDQQLLQQVFSRPILSQVQTAKVNVYNEVVPYVIGAHQILSSVHFRTLTIDNWPALLQTYKVADELSEREKVQGFAITGYPVALPHIVHADIDLPIIEFVTLTSPVNMKNMDDAVQQVQYLLIMLLPEKTLVRPFVSELSVLLMTYLDIPDKIFNDKDFVIQYMQQTLIKQISEKIY
ncbi:PRD domain-containing protein [Macrococcus hajekii]|uniref:PRD domain-containing protein n=1 Tax=Macrococcus hajekii TaxID=198482 RepID=A0A4R6BJ35_9STAP|nr:BglG family transcription antiterminator [Macrococcus hajekii]TDM01627.1 PRD domain-containing protein [Macrococcus hajekii]GGB01607.1 PTS lactose transporter subunit IIB [Macrococcus hajekii]